MPAEYQRRVLDEELDGVFPSLAAISLEGPKGVGKTATALQRARTTLRLDMPADRALVTADPTQVLGMERPLLVDEWQLRPETWDIVRRAVDDGASPGSFLLTGSATPTDRIHTGAGRIVSLRMRPMTMAERGVATPTVSLRSLLSGHGAVTGSTTVGLSTYVEQIIRSGFPGIRAVDSERALRVQLDGYLSRLVDRELIDNGLAQRRPVALRQWLTAYAACISTTTSYEKVRDAATGGERDKPTKVTSMGYRDALQRLWILDPVEAWIPGANHLKRLTAAPKHQLADPALAARLLGLSASALLGGHGTPRTAQDPRMLGRLFESLVTLDVRVYAQAAEARVGHLRTMGGEREVDLVVIGDAGQVIGIEVKLTATPQDADVTHLRWLREQLGDELVEAIVICTGPRAYRRSDGIAVLPAALLGP